MSRNRQHSGTRHQTDSLRALPSVDALARAIRAWRNYEDTAAPSAVQVSQAARSAIQAARTAIRLGQRSQVDMDTLVSDAATILERESRPAPTPVINATGVIINTNLGRAPLSPAALAAATAVGAGYSALEYDLERGERGSRQAPVRQLLQEILAAEDALVVNNNAAAVLVVLSALASGREVVISRGELVEIGGGFRIPDVLRQSGTRLVEVGTTNRTRIADYAAAITQDTAMMLAVHPSNYRIVGFTATPSLGELATLAHEHHLPLVHDVGSGALLRTEQWGLAHEPMPRESLAAGVDLVCFSGDKLLGGPQAGILAGSAELLARIEHHPLMRAVRVDKLTLAALVATLRAYRDGAAEDVPVWRMIATPLSAIEARARQWVATLRRAGIAAEALEGLSTIGGGSMPGETLPTWHCALTPPAADQTSVHDADSHDAEDAVASLARRLRHGQTTVVARVSRDHVLLDPRTILLEQDEALLRAIVDAYAAE
jgi:L-seryl-tRNA(Ser) seleniumtransferase